MIRTIAIAAVLFASAAFAQTGQETVPPPPPPLVDAPPQQQQQKQDAPVVNPNEAPTPPPPGAHLPGSQGQSGYQYSPYGAPMNKNQELPKEYGLMATEFLFGALTAVPIVLLPYLLFLRPMMQTPGSLSSQDTTLMNILFFVIFAGVPVAVAQTQIGLANGSRYYYSESWPAYLSGLGMQAAVVGLYYLLGSGTGAGEMVLLIGSIAIVPLAETVVINLLKTPRSDLPYGGAGLVQRGMDGEWRVTRPTPLPLFSRVGDRLTVGAQLPVLSGVF